MWRLLVVLVAACGPLGPREVGGQRPAGGEEIAVVDVATPIVVVERGDRGGRLVLVGHDGERVRALTEPPGGEPVLDVMPAWSPDGRWIVFASSRGRGSLEEWSLWIVSAIEPGDPVRLTEGEGTDLTPAWWPDGRSIVFASTRGGEGLDLWRLELELAAGAPPRAGALRRVTTGGPEELEPAPSPKGDRLACTGALGATSVILVMTPDGGDARPFTEGPADVAPAWMPDGKGLVFSGRASGDGRRDADLMRVDADGANRRLVLDAAGSEEQAARLSRDGRFVFATSVVRAEGRTAVWSHVIVVDLQDRRGPPRALAGKFPVPRMGVALAPVALDAAALGGLPTVDQALRRVFERDAE